MVGMSDVKSFLNILIKRSILLNNQPLYLAVRHRVVAFRIEKDAANLWSLVHRNPFYFVLFLKTLERFCSYIWSEKKIKKVRNSIGKRRNTAE